MTRNDLSFQFLGESFCFSWATRNLFPSILYAFANKHRIFDSTFMTQGAEALFSRNIGKHACSNVGMVIDFDHSSQGGQRNSCPELI